jgi:DNA gyrase subunit A
MAVLHHFDASAAERAAYLKMSRAVRGEGEPEESGAEPEEALAGELSQQRYAAMGAAEQFILTVSENGFGKRTSSFEYRITRRGGKGIVAMAVNERNGKLVTSFPVSAEDQIMLVTDAGKTIRMPVEGDKPIRIVGRGSQGVILFDMTEDEKVVSVEHIPEPGEGENGGTAPPDGTPPAEEPPQF